MTGQGTGAPDTGGLDRRQRDRAGRHEPDIADLRLGVTVARPTVAAARADAATTMTAILEAIDAAGVARRDLRTTLLSVQPRYDYRDGRAPALTGYELANVVEVTVRDLGTLAASSMAP